MIQLKVYKTPGDNDTALFLDLYETEPIKLTLSIEDVTRADATSIFSKTFRVPATRHNNEFFENAYEVDGINFDVTLKNQAQILVDGAEFREGHVRLQKIFRNQDLDRIDYELLFLGETRDFSSVIAEKTLCEINMTDFTWNDSDGNPYVSYTNAADFVGPFDYNDIVGSWNAFPENASLTAGTADGDILFPLIDHGNTYNNGDPEQGTIALGSNANGIRSFTHSNSNCSLGQDRLKPMIRAKRVWDQIFEDVGYTYSSEFLKSDRFHQMYVSAFGNAEQIGMVIGQSTGSIFSSEEGSNGDNQYGAYMFNNVVTQNQAGVYSIGSQAVGSSFICPGTSTPAGSYYLMEASASMRLEVENSNGPNSQVSGRVELVVVNSLGGSINRVLATGNFASNGSTSTLNWDSRNGNDVTAGERLQVNFYANSGFVDYDIISDTFWNCTAAPGDYYAPLDLDCEYKQIDFVKDILTAFRLVMQPDNNRPNNFIIEPWQDFIGSGTTYDWSHKLVEDMDTVLEPLFNTQSATIEYTFAEDEDFINKFHQDNNKHAYGYLQFNSTNELLKGTRKIEVKGIAPTPIDQILDTASTPSEPTFIIPSIVEVTGEQTSGSNPRPENLAIKPKTRLLFYNGEQNITVTANRWYLNNDSATAVLQTTWPLVSPYENWPPQQTSLNLNFSNDTRYYINPSPGSGYFDQGSTLFDEYWSRYISSLYNKFSRRLTAKFILNNVDLQDLTFDDVIFVNGKYYRPEKIIDAEVGAETVVTCQLITLNDQRPIWLDEPLDGFSVAVSNNNCLGEAGNIQITTQGTPPFTWQLSTSGATGTVNPSGSAPFTFIISAPVGVDTLIVTDSLGRIATVQVSVPASSATAVTSTNTQVNATDCTAPCNGEITVTPAGGVPGYTVIWNDGVNGATRTGLCPGNYQYYVEDSNGCQSDVVSVDLTCTTTGYTYVLREYLNNCTQISSAIYITSSTIQLPLNQVCTLNERAGCYYIQSVSTATPSYSVDALSPDCATCNGALTLYIYAAVYCGTTTTVYVESTIYPIANGTVMQLDTGSCVTIGANSPSETPTETLDDSQTYIDCDDCNGVIPPAQVCHVVTATSASMTFDYEFNGVSYSLALVSGDVVAVCAVTGTVIITTGTGTISVGTSPCTSPRACSVPPPPPASYTIEDCTSSSLWTVATQGALFSVGDVVQYQIGAPGSGAVYCGEILSTGNAIANASLTNVFVSYFCGDAVHCTP